MITLKNDYKFFFSKNILHANEILNDFFCNLFQKNIKIFPNASHFFG